VKLTQKQERELFTILEHLRRAQRYIDQPDIAVCRKGGMATTLLHYTRPGGPPLYEVDKGIGSDLTGLPEGIRRLREFLGLV